MNITLIFQYSTTTTLFIRKHKHGNAIMFITIASVEYWLIYNVGKQLFRLVRVHKIAVWQKYSSIIYTVISAEIAQSLDWTFVGSISVEMLMKVRHSRATMLTDVQWVDKRCLNNEVKITLLCLDLTFNNWNLLTMPAGKYCYSSSQLQSTYT